MQRDSAPVRAKFCTLDRLSFKNCKKDVFFQELFKSSRMPGVKFKLKNRLVRVLWGLESVRKVSEGPTLSRVFRRLSAAVAFIFSGDLFQGFETEHGELQRYEAIRSGFTAIQSSRVALNSPGARTARTFFEANISVTVRLEAMTF